jgi:CRP-like cAMP-binding protein
MNTRSSKLIFIIDGEVNVEVKDSEGNICHIDTLKKGDVVGQYSIINESELFFSLTTHTDCKIMTVDRDYLLNCQIAGMKEAI